MKYEIVQPIKLIDYSDKCLAVIGDTKPFKNDLKKMGGRFNYGLSWGAGWIFPMKKREELEKYVNSKGGDGRFKQLLLF